METVVITLLIFFVVLLIIEIFRNVILTMRLMEINGTLIAIKEIIKRSLK